MRRRSGRKRSMSKLTAGVIGIVALVVLFYLGFTKFANPFASPYTVHAVFSSANGVRLDSPVRIAGVNVGQVTSISPVSSCRYTTQVQGRCAAARVTMTIDNQGLPIHQDARFAIRPRIFLEGNFFIDLSPGSPSAPKAPDGFTFPVQQGVDPVQFDQVLSALPSDTRQSLRVLVQQYGKGVKLGGPDYNQSIQYWLPAYKYSSIVAHDALGIKSHDLSQAIDKGGVVAGAFGAHPQRLQSLVTDFNTTARRSPARTRRWSRAWPSCRGRCRPQSRPSMPSMPRSRRCARLPAR